MFSSASIFFRRVFRFIFQGIGAIALAILGGPGGRYDDRADDNDFPFDPRRRK